MTSHLRRHIEAGQLLFPEQLANALRRQEIYGGSLDTALLELELVDPVGLADWLQAACGLKPATHDRLARQSGRPWDAIDVELMRLSWAIPLSRDDGRLQIAVHPDLPDDRLGGLYRSVPALEPLVAPECCMEALHAEWLGSVVPQRYAVLSVAYISALRRAGGDTTQPDRAQRSNATMRYRWERGESPALVADDDATVAPAPGDTAPPASAPSDAGPAEPEPPLPEVPRWNPAAPPSPPIAIDLPPESSATLAAPSREDTAVGPAPSASTPRAPSVAGSIETGRRPRRMAPRAPLPDVIIGDGPRAEPLPVSDPPPRPRHDTEVVEVPLNHDPRPRARFTAQGTLIDDKGPQGRFDEADLVRRMAGARAVLQTTRSRDAAIEAVLTAAMVISPRVAVFRVRGAELVGLSTPRSKLADVGGKVVPMDEGTPIADAVADANFHGRLDDPDLALALQLPPDDRPSCVLRRIDVSGRPVLVVYIDNPTREFLPAELTQLESLCADAGEAFAAIVKARRVHGEGKPKPPSAGHDASAPGSLGSAPHANWGMPSDRLRAAYGHDDHVVHGPGADDDDDGVEVRPSLPAEERGPQFDPNSFQDDDEARLASEDTTALTPAPSPAPVTTDAASTDVAADRPTPSGESGPIDGEDPTEARATEEYAPGLEVARVTDPPADTPPTAEPTPAETDASGARLTVLSVPPPPPLPPPPVRFEVPSADDTAPPIRTEPRTLTGLPPIDDDPLVPADLELPTGLRDELDIISLASPIDQPTVRGRIELEAEDWAAPEPDASSSMVERIDAQVDALAAGEGDIRTLAQEGDGAFAALAARLPGPLEVLRRDLRALPPPAAHGPLIRAAIAAGPPLVPHLLELLHHPNPDVRFYGAYIFQELRDDRCAETLGTLAFDVSGDVRVIAMRVLETYSRAEQFPAACEAVRARLDSEDRTERLYAARAVGTLRDVEAIHRLIDLLASKDRFIQEAAIESLCSITGQQLGLKPHRWKSWFVDNRERHRIEWIIDSLRHKDMPVRQWAAHELSRITGHRIAFSPVADKRARDTAVRAWTQWWNAEGKARLGADRARL